MPEIAGVHSDEQDDQFGFKGWSPMAPEDADNDTVAGVLAGKNAHITSPNEGRTDHQISTSGEGTP